MAGLNLVELKRDLAQCFPDRMRELSLALAQQLNHNEVVTVGPLLDAQSSDATSRQTVCGQPVKRVAANVVVILRLHDRRLSPDELRPSPAEVARHCREGPHIGRTASGRRQIRSLGEVAKISLG
jgi:hypothetical protein